MIAAGLRLAVLWLWLILGLTGAALAQTTTGPANPPDYERWERVVSGIENTVASARAPDSTLVRLRGTVDEWRQIFQAAQTSNEARLDTLREQIAALGPPPEDGVAESEEIAALRSDLNGKLAQERAPVVRAEEAYSRANGVISEIDGILRNRQAQQLLHLGPNPLNPSNWVETLAALGRFSGGLQAEVISRWQGSAVRANPLGVGVPAALILLISALLLWRGRRWVEDLGARMLSPQSSAGKRASAMVLSLGQVLLPTLGVVGVSGAIMLLGIAGARLEAFLYALPDALMWLFGARWLGGQMFPDQQEYDPLDVFDADKRKSGRLFVAMLGGLLALHQLLSGLISFVPLSAAASVPLLFPLLVLSALVLYRLSHVLKPNVLTDEDPDDEPRTVPFGRRMLVVVSRLGVAVALMGIGAGVIGYSNAAETLIYASIQSLGLLGLTVVLQRFSSEIYGFLTGRTQDALLPVLMGFFLALSSIPVLALIWGARVSDLTEIWTRFNAGVSLGETRISPSDFAVFVAIFLLGYFLTRLLQAALRGSILPRTRLDKGGQNAVVSGVGYVGIVAAAMVAISVVGIDLSSLAIVAGALSVGIGFGLQNIVSNFVSGIILLIERPISEGDWIEVGGNTGIVKDISVRSTRIETFDRTDVIVPNADFVSGPVVNWTRGNSVGRLILPIGVAYGTDTRKVEAVLREVAESEPMVLLRPKPLILFRGFGADSLDFEMRVILRDINFGLSIRSELNHKIAQRFQEEGIEIPYAQRDIWLRNPEALGLAPAEVEETKPS